MFALTLPAMATKPYTSLPELILAHGIRNTTKDMPISHATLQKRMADPSTFTIGELERLAELAGEDLVTLVNLAKQQIDHPIKVPVSERGRSANKS